MIYPVLWMVAGSFKDNNEILNGGLAILPKVFHPENYITGWQGFAGITFSVFFRNSFFVSIVATIGTVLSSSCVAYGLSRIKFRTSKVWFSCMICTMMLPAQIILIPQYIIYNKLGMVGTYLPLVLPHFFGQPFFIYQMMSFGRSIPRELDEASLIDGCSRYGIFTRIFFPLLKPSIITTIIIQFYWKWDDYMSAMIYLSRPSMYTVSVAIKGFADATSTSAYGPMFAMSTLSLVPVFLIFLFFNRYLVQGISSTGIKM